MDMNENEKEEQKGGDMIPKKMTELADSVRLFELDDGEKPKKKKRKKRHERYLGYAVTSACLLIAFVVMITAIISVPPVQKEEIPAFDDVKSEENERLIYVHGVSDGGLSTAEIYAASLSSVVSISAEGVDSTGIGSGFIISEDGYIATANHVVDGAEHITVILSSGKEYSAQMVKGNAFTDLALLKINAKGLQTVQRGDSSDLLAGERVIAIGTPASLDYAGSVCSGEISFPNRVVKIYGDDGMLEKKMTLIQTDAPVNPGNSGCPLFDSEGKVIGIVTMKLGQNFSGVGFAIPANEAFNILESMRAGIDVGEELVSAISVRAAKLGVVAEAIETDGIYGVRINKFVSNEFDASRKLKLFDVITHVGDTAVTSAKKLSDAINKYAPGDSVAITVYRKGQKLTFDVVLGG